jgi:hypothetical protein
MLDLKQDRWTEPTFTELKMDAEIGSYQLDAEQPRDDQEAPPCSP